ncbi:MAG TPA: cysteine hydrolase [Xanthobacteraceae bacterium]|nr:cysteine hydrolase [Xanthobacteraceae bacterium]
MSAHSTALVLGDLQNDFVHPDGAYGRADQTSAAIAALPDKLAPLVRAARAHGVLVVATLFTLVPGRGGEPIISPHLKALRPFLKAGDFASGGWGQQLVDELAPADVAVEKVAYSAFYMSRLEWVLRKCGIERLYVTGIVTNGGVASTARDAHVRDFASTVIADGCAAFSEEIHRAAIEGLRPVARIITIADATQEIVASDAR